MQNIHFHLAYLLTNNECVILPGLGAFVSFPVQIKQDPVSGLWSAPSQSLSFNSRLSHNDGLLANSISKESNISFKEATQQIKSYVEQLEKQLKSGQSVYIPRVGRLKMTQEAKIEFTPDTKLSCNLHNYGLTNFYFLPLSDIEKEEEVVFYEPEVDVEQAAGNRMWKWIGTVAAAVAAIFLLTIPVNDYPLPDSQRANIIHIPSAPVQQAAYESTVDTVIPPDTIPADTLQMPPKVKANNGKYYYIIIASLPTKNLAEKKMAEYREGLFSGAGIVSKEDKHRIYVNRFEDKDEAEVYLKEFRHKYPQHAKAWLLSQRGQ